MDYQETGEELWRELHRMHENVRILRTLNKQAELHLCAFNKHCLFFGEIRWSLLEGLLLGISRMVDRRDDVLSLGAVLEEAQKDLPTGSNAKDITVALDMYRTLATSSEVVAVRMIRNKTIAHRAKKLNTDEYLEKATWAEVYGTVEKLCEIFNAGAKAGLWGSHLFGPEIVNVQAVGPRNLEEDIKVMIESLEAACHSDELHARIVERAKTWEDAEQQEG